MIYDLEIEQLAGETLAIQRFLVTLCSRLAAADPKLRRVVDAAFDEAADFLEDQTIAAGPSVSSHHLAYSVKVIENIRIGTFGIRKRPKHLV